MTMISAEFGGTYSTTLAAFEDDLEIRQLADTSGCYCIRSPDKVLYVGSSEVSMTGRISDHCKGRGTVYLFNRLQRGKHCQERITIMLCPTLPEEARSKEVELICELDPVYNSRQPNTGRY